MKNFYKILNISENASPEEIKKAYRDLAKKYHPDNKETGDAVKFREINEAYEYLKDGKKPINESENFWSFNENPFGFDFRQFINPDIFTDIIISLEEAFNGCTKPIHTGIGSPFELKIPKGTYPNTQFVKYGAGRAIYYSNNHSHIGDCYITVRISLNPEYTFTEFGKRKILTKKIFVDMFKSLLGGDIFIDNIDGAKLKVNIPQGVKEGQQLRIPKKGWFNNETKERDELLLEVHIQNRIYDFSEKDIKTLKDLEKKYAKL